MQHGHPARVFASWSPRLYNLLWYVNECHNNKEEAKTRPERPWDTGKMPVLHYFVVKIITATSGWAKSRMGGPQVPAPLQT